MRLSLAVLGSLLLVALIGAGTISCRTFRYINRPPPPPPAQPAVQPAALVAEPRHSSPHAVLVLDVSGSMRASDPRHLQTEAVRRFFDVYGRLSRETLEPGEDAWVSLVLFSTIAQTVDWTGSREPWLAVSQANAPTFERVIERYLGEGAGEPRDGQDTDYLAALRAVDRLSAPLAESPAIVFLTDGANEPSPFLSPVIPAERRARLLGGLHQTAQEAVRRAVDGQFDYLPASTMPEAFNARAMGIPQSRFPAEFESQARRAISDATRTIARRAYGSQAEGAVWVPMFLGGTASATDVRALLTAPDDARSPAALVQVSDPRDLVGAFVSVLSRWFRLQEIELTPGTRELSLPDVVTAFAVTLKTAQAVRSVDIHGAGGVKVPLNGRDGTWAGVVTGGGHWTISADGEAASAVRVFVRPRHAWALLSPNAVVVTSGTELVPIELHLIDVNGAVPPVAALLALLPVRVSAQLATPKGTQALELTRNPSSVVYSGTFPAAAAGLGEVTVSIDTAPLATPDVPVVVKRLQRTFRLAPGVRISVSDPLGRRTLPDIDGLPSEAGHVRDVVDRWRARLGQWGNRHE